MKIAFIRYRYDPFGGAERFTQAIMDRLAAKGAEIHLFARDWIGAPPSACIRMHRVGGLSKPPLVGYVSFVLLVGRAVRKMQFDLVQSNERTLCQDVYRAGDGVHARWLELRARRMGSLRRLSLRLNPFHRLRLWLECRLFEDPRLRAVVTNSSMVKEEILERFRIDPDRIVVIPNGVDLDRFHPAHRETVGAVLRRRAGVGDDETVFLFVGSGFERKGLEFAVRATAHASTTANLWVVGRGRSGPFRKLARKLGLEDRVRFWGPQGDAAPFYAAADALVLPTLYDPFPSVVLEAMASGLPVVTTAHCGAAEIITSGCEGFVVDRPDDVRRIARCLEILGRVDTRRSMGREARSRAEDFPWERTVTELETLYAALIAGMDPPFPECPHASKGRE